MSLREFIEEKSWALNYRERRQRRQEWVDAVARLMAQLRGWLKEADPDGLLDVVPLPIDKIEQGMGRYQTQGLRIDLADSSV